MLPKEFRYVKPSSDGLIVRYPGDKSILPEIGGVVPWVGAEGRYWRRRFNCGDVVIASQPKIKKDFEEDKSKKKLKEEEDKYGDIV